MRFGVLCLPGDQSHSVCATDNKPSCMLHLLGSFIGSCSFSSLERRPEFWVLHFGASPGSGKPRTQYQPQREVSPAGIEIYVICCLSVLCFGTRTGLVGIREADWRVHGLPNFNPGGRSRGDLGGWRQADCLPAGGATLSVSAPVWIVLETSISSSFRGARHFQCPLPSESVWRQFCTARLLVCISCVCFVSLCVFLFPPSSQHGTKTNYPSKFDSRTLERSQRPSQQPIGRSKKKEMANPLQFWMANPWRGMASGWHF